MSFHILECYYFLPTIAGFRYNDELGRGFVIIVAIFNASVEFNFEIGKPL